MFDFTCPDCNLVFEKLVHSFEKTTKCLHCGKTNAAKQISAPRLDWRRMGVSVDFPTSAGKWTKMQWEKNRTDKGGRADGQPNLKEY
jgi:putative FmdB family regulatory protein